MPIYPVINKNTQEKQELHMSLKDYEQWREDNPEWDKDWSAGTGGVTYGCLLYTSPSPRDRG